MWKNEKNCIFRVKKKKRVVLSREEEYECFHGTMTSSMIYRARYQEASTSFFLPQTGDTFVFAVCDPRGSKNVSHFRRFVLIYGARSTPRKWKRTLLLGREEPVKRHERWNTRHFHAMTFQVSRTTNHTPIEKLFKHFWDFCFSKANWIVPRLLLSQDNND